MIKQAKKMSFRTRQRAARDSHAKPISVHATSHEFVGVTEAEAQKIVHSDLVRTARQLWQRPPA